MVVLELIAGLCIVCGILAAYLAGEMQRGESAPVFDVDIAPPLAEQVHGAAVAFPRSFMQCGVPVLKIHSYLEKNVIIIHI